MAGDALTGKLPHILGLRLGSCEKLLLSYPLFPWFPPTTAPPTLLCPPLLHCSNRGQRRPKWFSFSNPIRGCWHFPVSPARSETSDRVKASKSSDQFKCSLLFVTVEIRFVADNNSCNVSHLSYNVVVRLLLWFVKHLLFSAAVLAA